MGGEIDEERRKREERREKRARERGFERTKKKERAPSSIVTYLHI